MTGLERIQCTVTAMETDRTPYAPLFGAYSLAYAGVDADRAYRDASIQADALLKTAIAHRSDAIFTLMDLSAEPEALGAGTAAGVGGRPVVTRYMDRAALCDVELEQRILTARVPVFLEAVRLLRQRVGDDLLVGALISGPLTAACNTLGVATVSRMLRRERSLIVTILRRLTGACIALSRAYAVAGAHAVALLEPCATPMILGPPDLQELLAPRLQQWAQAVRAAHRISILHVCGDATISVPSLASVGVDVLSLDTPVDLRAARDACTTTIMGNLDVRHLLTQGAPESVQQATRDLTAAMRSGGRFILSTGCEIPPETPVANVEALTAALAR